MPGPVSDAVAGFIGSLDGRLFLQPGGDAGQVLEVNGEPATATCWLADGDVIGCGALRVACHFGEEWLRFVVSYADAGYVTLPPAPAEVAGAGPVIAPRDRQPLPAPAPRPGRAWWPYAGMAVLGLLALELFTARAVGIEVSPQEARVSVRGGWLPLGFGGHWLLQPGSYVVHIEADGYAPLDAPLVVGEDRGQEHRFALAPLPGRLVLRDAPPVPLELRIDGEVVAAGEDGSYPAPAGSHELRVTAARYQPYEAPVEVAGRGERQEVGVALAPDWADVSVSSEPEGAQLTVDGEVLGRTPATVPVPSGTAQLELRLEGFKPWRQALVVEAGQQLSLPPVQLEESDGLLSVSSTPPGASLSIDGRYRGLTPLEAEVSPGRAHVVLVAKPGYESVTRSVTVARRGTASLRVELPARLGIVQVDSDPADAEVYVNGVLRGRAGQAFELPAVVQRIEVRKEGLAGFSTEVTPRPGTPQRVLARLLPPGQAAVAGLPKTVSTSQGRMLRLVGPGDFETGSPRREQGRRANETQRRVRITRSFYIGLHEVTNREFREFRPGHTSGAEKYRQLAGSDHPVVMLGWEDAARYCNWLSEREGLDPAYVARDGSLALAEPATRGYRLPTEAEWEWASRYNGGGTEQRYPWGDQMPPAPGSGNFADQSARELVANVLSGYNDGYPLTAPVGSFRASALGLYDLGGNVAEWVHDRYTVYAADPAPLVDPQGPASGQYHVIRGSSWRQASIGELRLAYRDFGDQGRLDVGFRLARNAD